VTDSKRIPLQNITIRTELGREIRRGFRGPSVVLSTMDMADLERTILEFMQKESKPR